ncbi:MAG: hypothetical protein FWE59_02635 [Oscillospiraceae bacterium]|nr:hypothetical protein [Oscillospiraceae bacterium]
MTIKGKIISLIALFIVSIVGIQPAAIGIQPRAGLLGATAYPNSISGFLWVDGDGSLPTDWNGLYDGDEMPLAGYTVSLYGEHGLLTPVAQAQTDADGLYRFLNLEPGSYIVGLAPGVVDGVKYLPPKFITDESAFAVAWDSEPFMAYSKAIDMVEGAAVENINAGMRLDMYVPGGEGEVGPFRSPGDPHGYPITSLAVSEAGKVYAPHDPLALTLSITPDGATIMTVVGVTWFRESVENPDNTEDSFHIGYNHAAAGDKGALPLAGSYGPHDIYAMDIDKNGRYWVQTQYTDGSGPDTYRVAYIDVDNIYTQVEAYVRDQDDDGTVGKPYTKFDGLYGIPFDLDGNAVLASPRHGHDTLAYSRNAARPAPAWDMAVPGRPFADTAAGSLSSVITLDDQVDEKADGGSTATEKYYTVKYKRALVIESTIDLSKASTALTGVGVSAATAWSAYGTNYPLAATTSAVTGVLTFSAAASGKAYKIIQSVSHPSAAHALKLGDPKFGTTYVLNIIISGTVTDLTLIIGNIHLLGYISISNTSKVTLLLDGESYVRGRIAVPSGGELTIDSYNGNHSADCLRIPQEINAAFSGYSTANTAARIGGNGSASANPGDAGKININGGKIDITAYSAGAGIGGGGSTSNSFFGGHGGTITISGGVTTVTQYGSASGGSGAVGIGPGGAGIGGGGGSTNNAGAGAGNLTIAGGTVDVTQYTRAAGIGGGTYGPAGNITISGGTVDVEVKRFDPKKSGSGEGAGIGNAGCSNHGTGNIMISGGKTSAVALYTGIGRVHTLSSGSSQLSITITGGEVYAEGSEGPGIGHWCASSGSLITITGGTVVAKSQLTAAIGSRIDSDTNTPQRPRLVLDAGAKVWAYSGALDNNSAGRPKPAIDTQNNEGDGYIVNAGFNAPPSATAATTMYVYADGQVAPLLNTLTLPAGYRHFAYSTGNTAPQTDNIYTDTGIVVHSEDTTHTDIFSVKTRDGYVGHSANINFVNTFWLSVMIMKDIHILYNDNHSGDTRLQRVAEGPGNQFTILSNEVTAFTGPAGTPRFVGWSRNRGGPVDPDYASGKNITLTESITLFAQWEEGQPEPEFSTLAVSKTVRGDFGDRMKEFAFTIEFFEDATGTPHIFTEPFVCAFRDGYEVVVSTLMPAGNAVTFKLRHGEGIILKDVPEDCWVRVKEEVDPALYNASFVDSDNPHATEEKGRNTGLPRKMSEGREFRFINERFIIVPTGVDVGNIGAILLLPAVALLSVLTFYTSKVIFHRLRGGI